MAISLSQLCANAEKDHEMKLIAGSAGLENTVRWVHMVEDSEVPGFLHGNELIFTTGIGHVGNEWLKEFTVSMRKKGAVGLVLNIGPYITSVPSQVIVFCEQNGFPLFTIPWETRIIDISYEFCRRIIANEKHESTVADAFRALIKDPDSAGEFSELLERSGFRSDNQFTVISLEIIKNGKAVTEKIVRTSDMMLWRALKRSRYPSSLFIQGGALIAIKQNCSDEEIDIFCNALKPIIDGIPGADPYIGVSDKVTGLTGISEAYSQSKAAIGTARINNNNVEFYRDIGTMKLIFGIKNVKILESFAKENLGVLHRYDAEHSSELCKLLRTYLELNGSVNEVASAAGVHRNTVNYKIKSIRDIIGHELDDKMKNMLMLAYLIEDVLDINNNNYGGNKK